MAHRGLQSDSSGVRGLYAAASTPINADFACDSTLLVEHCRHLIESGCDGIALFGTTGEGPLFSVEQRVAALEAMVEAGISPSRVVVSASAVELTDVVQLARHAVDAGCAAVLLMPPFFFREQISEAGVFQFYATAIERIARPKLRLFLYHFPAMTGIAITARLTRRLVERFPGIIAGLKDSGGDWDFTESLLTKFSDLTIVSGTEVHVPRLLASGGAGTICGLANVIPALMRRTFDAPGFTERRGFVPMIRTAESMMSRGPFICCLKSVLAAKTGNPDWRRVQPPLYPLPALEESKLVADFRRFETTLAEV